MTEDDRTAIARVMTDWMAATRTGDTAAILALMTDDAVFLAPDAEPFGREAFAAASNGQTGLDIDGEAEAEEIRVLGDWAFMRTRLRMTVTASDGTRVKRSGRSLSILRKESDGRWRLTRDANLVTED